MVLYGLREVKYQVDFTSISISVRFIFVDMN